MRLKGLTTVILGGVMLVFGASFAAAQGDGQPRQLSKKEEKQRLERLRKELAGPFKRWLEEDVRYIITDEERKAFFQFSTDEERENFIEGFWQRRDPTPDTMENEYKEEHYRRIAYANERYASGLPGWKTWRWVALTA